MRQPNQSQQSRPTRQPVQLLQPRTRHLPRLLRQLRPPPLNRRPRQANPRRSCWKRSPSARTSSTKAKRWSAVGSSQSRMLSDEARTSSQSPDTTTVRADSTAPYGKLTPTECRRSTSCTSAPRSSYRLPKIWTRRTSTLRDLDPWSGHHHHPRSRRIGTTSQSEPPPAGPSGEPTVAVRKLR